VRANATICLIHQANYLLDQQIAALEKALGSLGGKAILDAGCGIGLLSKEIVLRGGRAVGVDLSETALARAKAYAPGAQFECHSLDMMPYESTFDGAVSMDVLFHVVDDAQWKASILRLVKAVEPGGVVVIQEAFEKGEARHPHLRWRTLEDYREVLAETGARIRAVETYTSPREGAEKTLLTIESAMRLRTSA
jgi:2-polyprenyl-3-methyl-5-hydroxy-6-metoxy-1,4-benzoquinol methylase